MVVKPGSSLSKEAKIRAGQLSVFALFFSPTCLETKYNFLFSEPVVPEAPWDQVSFSEPVLTESD
jgi:hypothetical protein